MAGYSVLDNLILFFILYMYWEYSNRVFRQYLPLFHQVFLKNFNVLCAFGLRLEIFEIINFWPWIEFILDFAEPWLTYKKKFDSYYDLLGAFLKDLGTFSLKFGRIGNLLKN